MSMLNEIRKGVGQAGASTEPLLDGTGIGEQEDFLTQENHLFINKLNYICKNYDTSFKDVKHIKRLLEDQVLHTIDKQRLIVNDNTDKVDSVQQKVSTIEKHLPTMIQEILEYYFDKKVSDLLATVVTREEYQESLSLKLDYCIFRDYEKMISTDRSQELKNFNYEEKLYNQERSLLNYVTKDEWAMEMKVKVDNEKLDELRESLEKQRNIGLTLEENISQKLLNLKDDFESKTKEMLDNIEDLNKKMDEIEEEGSYDDESDGDLDSELGDTLDVNDINAHPINDKDKMSDTTPQTKDKLGGIRKSHSTSQEGGFDEIGSGSGDQPDPSKDQQSSTTGGQDFAKTMANPAGILASPEHKGAHPPLRTQQSMIEPDSSPINRRHRQHSMAGSQSDVNSSQNQSRRSRKFKIRRQGGDESSRLDSSSQYSGLMSRATKRTKRGKGGKRSLSLAVQHEGLINKIQEQIVELKTSVNADIQRIDKDMETTNGTLEERLANFQDNIANNSQEGIQGQIAAIKKMEESQNFVLKDCHEKVQEMSKRIVELERTDFDDKFNQITRRMIADVVREHLTPVHQSINIELKSIKKLAEEHAFNMEQFQDELKEFKEDLDDFRLKNIYDLQNNKKEAESYLRELLRMQKLDHVRVQVSQQKSMATTTTGGQGWFNKTADFLSFNQASALNSIENESLTQDSLFVNQEREQGSAGNTFRAQLTKTPAMQHNINHNNSTSTQYKTIQNEEVNIRDSNLLVNNMHHVNAKITNGRLGSVNGNEGSGPIHQRHLKPSKRNQVIMTRSVDHQDQRSFIGSQGQSSIFGTSKQGDKNVTARMHLNKNTTLELIDSTPKSNVRKYASPFSNKAQERERKQQMQQERGKQIQQEILKQYNIEPFNTTFQQKNKSLIEETNSSQATSSRKHFVPTLTPPAHSTRLKFGSTTTQPFSDIKKKPN